MGRPWTAYEDSCLSEAVARYGENADWKTIALQIPGRTNKACRKRWLHSLSPTIKKSAWAREEDEALVSLYDIHGPKWSLIARHIPGRTDDACSKRYREALDPLLRKEDWAPEEDAKLLEISTRLGRKWKQVGQEMQRSGLGCRNRWRLLERKGMRAPFAQPTVDLTATMLPPFPHLPLDMGTSGSSEYWHDLTIHGINVQAHRHPTMSTSTSVDICNVENSIHVRHPLPAFQPSSSSLSAALALEDANDSRMDTPSSSSRHRSPSHHSTSDVTLQVQSAQETGDHTLIDVEHDFSYSSLTSSRALLDISQAYSMDRHGSPQVDAVCSSPVPSQCLDSGLQSASSTPVIATPRALSVPSSAPSEDESALDSQSNQSTPFVPNPSPLSLASPRAGSSRINHRIDDSKVSLPILSATLPASEDPSILGYSCGNSQCWLPDTSKSKFCFATSKALSEHVRAQHPNDLDADSKPYRCGLQGCGRGWKSINGLQYHLQISKAHFRQAISTLASATATVIEPLATQPFEQEPGANIVKKRKKTYPCPHSNCLHVYKQLSGLRYHLVHGHPREPPAQLHHVPPTLARKVAEKLQRETGGT